MNKYLKQMARDYIKENLNKCTEEQQLVFKRIYSHDNMEASIDEIIAKIPDDKLDMAMTKIDNTLSKNIKEV